MKLFSKPDDETEAEMEQDQTSDWNYKKVGSESKKTRGWQEKTNWLVVMKSDIIPYVGTKVNLPTSYEIPAYSIVTGGSLPVSSLAVILGPKKKKKNLEVIFFTVFTQTRILKEIDQL